MELPFTLEQFMQVFRDYNLQVFPAQIILMVLAGIIIALSFFKISHSDRMISGMLSVLWLWMGIVYHWGYFSGINKAAYLFGGLFVFQGALFLFTGLFHNALIFKYKNDLKGWVGVALLFYALVVYPVLGHALGHRYPASPTFGLPCPTTIFTFGILLWVDRRPPFYLLIIPLLWALVGSSAALNLGIREDFGLPLAGLATVWLRWRHRSDG